MYFGSFCFRGELGFLNCGDICMCVVSKQFELLEFGLNSVYVDLKYNEIYLTFTAGYVCLYGVYSHVVCEVVLVPYVDAVADVCTVVCVGCEDARVTEMLV